MKKRVHHHLKHLRSVTTKARVPKKTLLILGAVITVCLFLGVTVVLSYQRTYLNRAYPGITIATVPVTGWTHEQIVTYWLNYNKRFSPLIFTLKHEQQTATLSAASLHIGYDATLAATQALNIGRTGNLLSDLSQMLHAVTQRLVIHPLFTWNREELDEALDSFAQQINIEPENALFDFKNGRVVAFKTASSGRMLDVESFNRQFATQLERIAIDTNSPQQIVLTLPVVAKPPLISTEQANSFGIIELIGKGESLFRGSIAGRVHNVALAASRLNGVLIPPNETLSFNDTLGDISAATGYKQAYVIKSGRTVLDDGGGVCQVSTTLFRAALNSGLPVIERHAHSYRVGYYEQGGWKPGFDATVYAPTYDLKIKNDTGTHILIQTTADTKNYSLTFELYGKKDGRIASVSAVRLWDSKPAPPDLFQDDPTLPTGQVKQVDWANPGIKAAFDYTVTKNDEVVFSKNFYSNFVPWQAVYLRGTGPQ